MESDVVCPLLLFSLLLFLVEVDVLFEESVSDLVSDLSPLFSVDFVLRVEPDEPSPLEVLESDAVLSEEEVLSFLESESLLPVSVVGAVPFNCGSGWLLCTLLSSAG